jgi:hypothetical protein
VLGLMWNVVLVTLLQGEFLWSAVSPLLWLLTWSATLG